MTDYGEPAAGSRGTVHCGRLQAVAQCVAGGEGVLSRRPAAFPGGRSGGGGAALSRSVEQAPEFWDAYVFLGIANALTYNIYPAFDHLEEAVALQPDSFAAHFTLAQLNFKLRIPQKGYASAGAFASATTLEQRKMLTPLLSEEGKGTKWDRSAVV